MVCLDLPVDFYWYGGGNGTGQEHITLARLRGHQGLGEPPKLELRRVSDNCADFRSALKAAQGKLPTGRTEISTW